MKPTIKLRQINGVFVKSIGYYVSPRDGQERERVFTLGTDRTEAERTAVARLSVWAKMKTEGRRVWTELDESAVQVLLARDSFSAWQAHKQATLPDLPPPPVAAPHPSDRT